MFVSNVHIQGMLPGIAYYLSRWYRKSELIVRLALYVAAAPLAGAFGGLLASGILKLDGIGSLKSWRQLFLVELLDTSQEWAVYSANSVALFPEASSPVDSQSLDISP